MVSAGASISHLISFDGAPVYWYNIVAISCITQCVLAEMQLESHHFLLPLRYLARLGVNLSNTV